MTLAGPVELEQMKSLGDLAGEARGILRAMRRVQPLTTTRVPSEYARRPGYSRDFLPGFQVCHPTMTGRCIDDAAPLLDGSGVELKYQHFSVVMSKSRRLAMYVACNIDGKRSRKIRRGRDRWYLDPRIDSAYQIGEELYSRNDLDRGHLVRREDPVWGEKQDAALGNLDSFHFTNCSPQHEKYNQRTWLGLENYILLNSRAHDLKVSLFTGPVFKKDDPAYRDVLIPREYWKVVAVVSEGRPSATAYLISQAELLHNLRAFGFGKYKTYQVSIGQIEQMTDLCFGNLKQYDGFTTEEGRTRRALRQEILTWEDIRI